MYNEEHNHLHLHEITVFMTDLWSYLFYSNALLEMYEKHFFGDNCFHNIKT